jgi:tetratricopeptide (TPR) repeat protein
MFFGRREEDAQRLHDAALACLAEGDTAGARRIAASLRGMQWSGAFELEALAFRAEGALESAIAVLEEGTAAAPGAWPLLQLLGTLRDQAGDHEGASAAFDAALRAPGAWQASIRHNRAVSRLRAGDPGSALADAEVALAEPGSPAFLLDALRVGIDALHQLGRAADARSLVRTIDATLKVEDVRGHAELSGFAALTAARAGASREVVRAALEAAIEGWSSRGEVLEAMALLDADGEAPSVFRVAHSFPAPPDAPSDVVGYVRVVEVRAPDRDTAAALAITLEPGSVRASRTLEACEEVAVAPGRVGVLGASARLWHGA